MKTTMQTNIRRIPGEEGVWIFVVGDMIVFALFFSVFLYYRGLDPATFIDGQASLNPLYGVINTVLLLTSSWCVASAIEALRGGRAAPAYRLILGAMACGAGFGLIKIIEYSEKIRGGFTIVTTDFFMYYYILTGVHFLHVIIGMGVLAFMAGKARAGATGKNDIRNYEAGGIYWHMVDLLWIILFPLIYLL